MTSTNKLIEIKYLNDSPEYFDCYENLNDFIEEIKEKFSINEKDLKENVIFYIVDDKKKQKIDIFKDYDKFILKNDKMIIYLEMENKNKIISNENKINSNENKKNNFINNNNNNKLITKDQIKTILDKNNENLINNFSTNLNNLNSKINSIEKTMIEINKNIQNVPNLINQTFSIQFPPIEEKINKKLVNLQKMIISLIKNNKNEISNILENFNTNLLNMTVALPNNEKNNNNYDILLENHNKLKEELSNKNKIEAELKTKIKEFEKKIENINLSNKNNENDYVKKMKENLNKIKKFQENEKKMKNEIYLLKEKINNLENSNKNFFEINNENKNNIKNNNNNKNNIKNNNNNNIKNNNNNIKNNNNTINYNNNNNIRSTFNYIKGSKINFSSDSEEKNKINDESSDEKEKIDSDEENENKNNKINNDILNESIKYYYEFVPNENTYFIEKSKLKELNNKSVSYKISIKNKGKNSIPVNSYVANENLVNNNYFKFYGKILKEIKPNETAIVNGKILVNFNDNIKKNYILVLKLYDKDKKEFSDVKFILNINIISNKKSNIIKELTKEQINKIISEIYDKFENNELILRKFDFKNEISNLMKDENFQDFDDFNDLKDKIIDELIDKICSD